MLEALPPGPPRLVGPYRLLARLGAGGMGEVHLACRADAPTADPYLMVAVKTVREDLEVDEDFRTRFRREITAARAVRSAYAAQLVDADADAVSPWLATEYVPGPSLAEAVVRAGALPVAAVRALGATLARALQAVHAAQVLHRDLKPANVLLGASGPKLIDFGIAQAFEATALTSTGLVVGSPGFMSPEHLIGSRAVVPASDVFCLGAVLAFAACGQGPFQDDEMAAVFFRISRAEAELGGVPEELRPVVARCLHLDPAERPTAAELVELLGGGTEAAFPWPAGVLSLLAGYGDAAREIGEAAASGAGVADLPTLAPEVPYSPTAMVSRPRTTAPAQRPRPRRRWAVFAAGAAAVALVATGIVMLDGRDDKGASAGGGAAGAAAGGGSATGAATPSTGGGPAALDHVVHPYAGEGHGRDFGADGSDRRARPAGWSPWAVKVEATGGPCALAPQVIVCTGSGGGVAALRASDGGKAWSEPAQGDPSQPVSPQYPAVVGDRVWITRHDGLVAYRSADGSEAGRLPAPGAPYVVKGTDLLGDVLYTTYVDMTGMETPGGLVTAVRLSGGTAKELWRTRIGVFPESPVASGGRVYVPGNGTVMALDARTGRETARATGLNSCFTLVVAKGGVLCPAGRSDGIDVLDRGTLRRKRTIAEGVELTGAPAVDARGVVAVTDGRRLVTYDLDSGAERWSRPGGGSWVAFAGDQVLTGSGTSVTATDVDDPAQASSGRERTFAVPDELRQQLDAVEGDPNVSGVVAAGGAVFLAGADGLVISGYTP
ncbi:protein kinase [Streptomyces sp. NPDC048018]|uniref:protein kinase domain-containing protein n=1 Tax=Streptomyces sp. NPDC048018 TaxID=3365499 RepID=UPI00371F3054